MTYFLLRDYNILPREELPLSPWVSLICHSYGPGGVTKATSTCPTSTCATRRLPRTSGPSTGSRASRTRPPRVRRRSKVFSSTPQLPFKISQRPSNRDYKAPDRGTLGGLGWGCCFFVQLVVVVIRLSPEGWLAGHVLVKRGVQLLNIHDVYSDPRIPGPPKKPKIMALCPNIESISSIGSIIWAILEVQVGSAENVGKVAGTLTAAQPQADLMNTISIQSEISLFLPTAVTNCKAIASHIRNIVEQP